MHQIRVFISSVQNEFAEKRTALYDYLHEDPVLGRFLLPFIFEKSPATDDSAKKVYLEQVEKCDIYLGIFGAKYGWEDKTSISPTEREFDYATLHHKTKLIFFTNHTDDERHIKEVKLIRKAEQVVLRKQFSCVEELKSSVYASLVKYLENKEFIRTVPFDASWHKNAGMDELDEEKIRYFVRTSSKSRHFPLSPDSRIEDILTHLNLYDNGKINHASILLFGKNPQKYFISSEIKCAHFYGTEITKPIPSYHIYKGDVFQLVNQAVDFVMSRIDLAVGTRAESTQASTQYELPREAIAEAIINAVAHRDYTSNGSVQVMLFKDRLEVWNPGRLPFELTISQLYKPHHSIPNNPILANPMYLAGYIEQMGTGTGDIIKHCETYGLKKPEFVQEEIFKTILWRKASTGQVTGQVQREVLMLISILTTPKKRSEIQEILGLKHREYFVDSYLNPSLYDGYIEMLYPDVPNHPQQEYQLSEKGKTLKQELDTIYTDQVTDQVRDEILHLVSLFDVNEEKKENKYKMGWS
ncbi:MAG: DUF4062 domain-containing protein [Paludibacteraceae bacterium]